MSLSSLPEVSALRLRQTAADHITAALRAAIQSGALPDGLELSQVGLAQHFGVSRVPVREALRVLEAEGWITAPTNQRAFVQSLSAAEIDEIFRIRLCLEPDLLGQALPRMNRTVIDDLRARCATMDALKDHALWVTSNRAFHGALLAPSGAKFTLRLLENLTAQVERYVRLQHANSDRHKDAGHEHSTLIDAVERRDVRTARSILRKHIERSRAGVLAAVRNLSKNSGDRHESDAARARRTAS